MTHAAPELPDLGKRDAWSTRPARHLKRPADPHAQAANLEAELVASRLPLRFHVNTGATGIVVKASKPKYRRT